MLLWQVSHDCTTARCSSSRESPAGCQHVKATAGCVLSRPGRDDDLHGSLHTCCLPSWGVRGGGGK